TSTWCLLVEELGVRAETSNAELSKAGSGRRALMFTAVKQPSACPRGAVRAGSGAIFFKIRVLASSSLIMPNLINWQSAIGNSDEIASTQRSRCRQVQFADWKRLILRDILALHW